MENEHLEHENELVTDHLQEIEEMKGNLDRKEYLIQYTEQRNTQLEKVLIKQAPQDEYIKKRLAGLGVEPKIGRSI